MDGLQYCAVPMFLGQSGECRWNKHAITYSVTASLPGLADNIWLDALKQAWSFWEAVCNIKATYTDDAASADVVVGTGSIDGPSGVLAWSEMPCSGQDMTLRQRFDSGELHWVVAENPPPGTLDIVRVACHEIGHVIGLPHFPQGTQALLAPTYSTTIRRPTQLDVEVAVERYGPPVVAPAPVPPTPVPIPPIPSPAPSPGPGGIVDLFSIISTVLTSIVKATPTPVDDAILPIALAFLKALLNGTLSPAKAQSMLASENITVA